tara:strand:+ start:60 stop:572 length:513 start_codon:yes stop_codon:yes gene_type:complete
MQRLNRDVIIAIILLAFCGSLYWASFDIRQPDYGVLMPSTWPRVIIGVLAFLSTIYLFQSFNSGPDPLVESDSNTKESKESGFLGWLKYWRNPLWCYLLFFFYLLLMPVLGMLISSITFVYILLGALGGWDGKKPIFHAVIAVIAMGSMWSIFTFGLGVMLPSGIFMDAF